MSKTNLKQRLIKIIYPIDCLECGEEGEWLCQKCVKKHLVVKLDNCFICGKIGSNGICPKCQKNTKIDGVVSLLPYSVNASLQLIYNAKYYGHHDALKFITESFKNKILRLLPEKFQQITFVPTTPVKQKERGYNPAEVIAKSLADDQLEIIYVFEKFKETASQTSLTKAKRKKNVKNVFKVKLKKPPEYLLIVDDVITTGATLGELAKLAKKNGSKNVWVVTICHG